MQQPDAVCRQKQAHQLASPENQATRTLLGKEDCLDRLC